jgi:ribonucleoside-diphosphate reductase alpha chain
MPGRVMTERCRLSNRRASMTFDIEVAGLRYKATISFFPDGSLGELFVSNHKSGNASDVAARDAGILVSLCLQHGCPVETIAHALSRNADGTASGVVGAVLDKVIRDGGRP